MQPKPVIGWDPTPQSFLVTDQAFGYSSDDITVASGELLPEPSGFFERLLSRKGASTSVHRATRIPSDPALRTSPGGQGGISPYDGVVRELLNG